MGGIRCRVSRFGTLSYLLELIASRRRRGSATPENHGIWTTANTVVPAPLFFFFSCPFGLAEGALRRAGGGGAYGLSQQAAMGLVEACDDSVLFTGSTAVFPLAGASAWEVGELPRKSSPGPPPAADMAVDSSMELLFLDTFKHPSAEVRPRDPISTRPLSSGTPAAESGAVRAVSSLSRARAGVLWSTPPPPARCEPGGPGRRPCLSRL